MFTQTPEGAIISAHVTPNSKQFSVLGKGEWANTLKIKVMNQADKGKANHELCTELGKILNSKVKIISGEKSHNKKLLVVGKTIDEIEQKLLIR